MHAKLRMCVAPNMNKFILGKYYFYIVRDPQRSSSGPNHGYYYFNRWLTSCCKKSCTPSGPCVRGSGGTQATTGSICSGSWWSPPPSSSSRWSARTGSRGTHWIATLFPVTSWWGRSWRRWFWCWIFSLSCRWEVVKHDVLLWVRKRNVFMLLWKHNVPIQIKYVNEDIIVWWYIYKGIMVHMITDTVTKIEVIINISNQGWQVIVWHMKHQSTIVKCEMLLSICW